MKKSIVASLLTIASIFAIVSCSVKELSVSEPQETHKVHFIVNSSSPETKTYIDCVEVDGENLYEVGWHSSDENLAVFISEINGSTSSVEYTFVNTKPKGTEASFEGDADIPAEGKGEFYSFYPASAFVKGYADGTVGVNIGEIDSESKLYVQSPIAGSFDRNSDILIGKKCAYESDGDLVVIDDMYFTRPLSILKVNLLGDYAEGDVVKSFKLTAPEGTVLGGRAKLNLTDYTISDWTVKNNYVYAEIDNTDGDITINTGNNAVYLFVNPVTIAKMADEENANTVVFDIETDKNTISKTVSLGKDLSFPAGNIAVINLTIVEANCTPKEVFTPKVYNLVSSASALEETETIIVDSYASEETLYYLPNPKASKPTSLAVNKTGVTIASDKSSITINSADVTDMSFILSGNNTDGFKITSCADNTLGLGCTASSNSLSIQTTYIDYLWKFTVSTDYGWQIFNTDKSMYLAVFSATSIRNYSTATTNQNGKFYIYQLEDNRTALAKPTDLSISGKTLSWTAVEGAASYIVTVGTTMARDITETSYTFEGEDGYYDVSVIAVPSDTEANKNSDAATLSDAKFGTPALPAPVLANGGVTTTSVTATWTDDANATNGYHCEIYNVETKINEQDVAKGVQKVTFTGLTEGVTYTVKVNAKEVTGDKPYAASAVATIDLVPEGLHAEDVTSAGSYVISDLEVKVTMGTAQFIAGDATGLVYVYKSSHGLSVGDVITVDGAASAYSNNGGILQFSSPTITVQSDGNGTATHGTAVELSDSYLTNYESSPVPVYVHASGAQDGLNITVGTKVLHLYAENTATDGKMVNVSGYLYGYSSRYSNYNFVATSITEDTTTPTLETTPTDGNTISWDDDKFGIANAETITVDLNAAATGYTVSFTDTESAWTVSDDENGTITVYPNEANGSDSSDKTLTITITHDDDSSLASEITLIQKKQSGSFTPFNVWEDSFANCTNSSTALNSLSGSTTGFTGDYSSISTTYPMNGAIRIGKASGAGSITTPALSSISGTSVDLTVTFIAAGWNGTTAKLTLTASKGSVTEGQTTITSESTMSGNTPTMTGTSYTFHITGADNSTTVTFATTCSIGIDNLVITQTSN